MFRTLPIVLVLTIWSGSAAAQSPAPFLSEPVLSALAQETSGEAAKLHVERFSGLHRMRGSRPFRSATDYIVEKLKAYGLKDARVESLKADGVTFYGTQRSRQPWNAEFAELWELRETPQGFERAERLASFDAIPLTLAQDSSSGQVTAELVDVGAGTKEADYAGKDVKGKLVLISSQPEAAAPLAVERFGAAGMLSYAQNQRTAWWREDETLVRWGHLDDFAKTPSFAFMLSLKQARRFQERLAGGERVRLEANVRAGRSKGAYEIASATIPGREKDEVVFSCHLDHPRPGANDNASGCAAILESARTLAELVRQGRLAQPRLTLRFVWPPEVEGTLALLAAKPEWAARVKAAIHLDMVGGGPETKAVFHVTRGPASRPSFVNDVAEALADFANDESYRFAASGQADFPLVSREGGKEPLRAEAAEFSMGSDHQVYADASFGIPAIYMNDWPDRYIHTTGDTPANIDPTKLKRAAFLAAASGYVLATLGEAQVPELLGVIESNALRRSARMLERRATLPGDEAANLTRFQLAFERGVVDSVERFTPLAPASRERAKQFLDRLEALVGAPALSAVGAGAAGDAALVFRRAAEPRGPMTAFGYDYLPDKYGAEKTESLQLLKFEGLRGDGGDYAYEALNFADGRRSVQDIRDALSAEYGPVPLEAVLEYLRALESIGVLTLAPPR